MLEKRCFIVFFVLLIAFLLYGLRLVVLCFSSFRSLWGLLKKEKWGREGNVDLIYDNLYVISAILLNKCIMFFKIIFTFAIEFIKRAPFVN